MHLLQRFLSFLGGEGQLRGCYHFLFFCLWEKTDLNDSTDWSSQEIGRTQTKKDDQHINIRTESYFNGPPDHLVSAGTLVFSNSMIIELLIHKCVDFATLGR